MNTLRLSRVLSIALLLGATALPAWAESARSRALGEQDPQGFILTLTAVMVVFSALLMLVIVFRFIGKMMQRMSKSRQDKAQSPTECKTNTSAGGAKPTGEAVVAITLALQTELGARSGEVAAAIAMALRAELDQRHDMESYVLTINRRNTQWHSRSQGMRKYNY
ncbi:OadG family protein [Porphyromonas sp. COT-290 OH3588]|uniref:OadG family protein n=1 Tax=Porphyromonas sp. COT-290 OH3588 TaxID=1515617 RepID=UPI00052E4687|nr:OadG family protein [Porphyromonas sp. COT-290 OH3588]KGN98864.1 hypothetical protein HQ48_07635 [Porphyromonas sp. COT-290 OH3588]